jgi:hypothetical protein
MVEGGAFILAVTLIAVGGAILIAWVIDRRPGPVTPDEPHGDATDTPQMRMNTRRANWKRDAD